MAIIYTYPRLNNPDGTELIVVSETKNKNSTRLITLAGICDFCGDSACSNSFKTITTGGDSGISTAIGCDANLNITSSDASVTITTPIDGTVDIKVPIVNPCPITYVIKPVECDEETGACTIIDKSALWTYTNDCFFADFAPGYLKDFTLNGVGFNPDGPPGEGSFNCYYVEEAVWGATIGSCETCCGGPADPVITITPCGGLAPGPTSTLQSNITGPVGWESAIDNPCQFGFAAGQFGDWPCLDISIGGVDTGSIVNLTEINTVDEPCSCECCLYPCSFTLTPCDGEIPAAFDPVVGAVVQPSSWPTTQPCEFNDGETVAITFEGETWCFVLTSVCLDPSFSLPMTIVKDCFSEACSGAPGIRHKFTSCSDPLVSFVEEADPLIPIGSIRRYCCEETENIDLCYEYVGTTEDPSSLPPCPVAVADEPECVCCEYPCNYQYTACDGDLPAGFTETIIVNTGKDKEGCECVITPLNIFVEIDGSTWCYNTPVKTCEPDNVTIAGEAECGDPEYCPSGPVTRKYRSCGSDAWFAEDPLSPIPFPGAPAKLYAGDLSGADCVFPNCCIEIETTFEILDPLPWIGFIALNTCGEGLGTIDDCDCCKFFDVATYTNCDPECEIEGFPAVNIDVCSWGKSLPVPQDWKPSTSPDYIKINIGGDVECCYEKTNPTPCESETLISVAELAYGDLSFDVAWESCNDCNERWFRYENCAIPDEIFYTSDVLNPGIEGLSLPFIGMVNDNTTCENDPSSCCVQIVQEELEKPLTLTQIDCWDTAYINSNENCECCVYQNTHTYVKCDSEGCLIEPEFNVVNLDTCEWFNITQASGTPIPQIVQVEIDGNICCYNATGEWACEEPIKVDDVVIFEDDPNDCETCDASISNFKITNCVDGVVTTTTEDLSAFVGQTWLIDEEVCVTVDNYHGPAGPPLGSSFDTQFEQDPPCDCCRYRDVLQYDKCDSVEPGAEACDLMPATIYVTNTVTAGAVNAIFQETANPSNQCCYVLNETPPCVPDQDSTYTYVIWEETCDELPAVCVS